MKRLATIWLVCAAAGWIAVVGAAIGLALAIDGAAAKPEAAGLAAPLDGPAP